jgi:T-complex protein 1 subunit alpha
MILDAGVNVILSTMGIDDLAQKLLIKNGVMGIRRIEKSKLRFIARSCGATIVTSLADEDDTQDGIFESFDKSCVGHAEVVYEDTVGDMDYLFIERMEKSTCCTMLLRGPNDFMLDEIDRSIHDAVCVMKRTLESGYVVPGGGACEIALCTYLKEFAKTLHTKAQEAVLEFA